MMQILSQLGSTVYFGSACYFELKPLSAILNYHYCSNDDNETKAKVKVLKAMLWYMGYQVGLSIESVFYKKLREKKRF
jgi:hypothetical protein